jgi:Flp pilus assembly protein TadD
MANLFIGAQSHKKWVPGRRYGWGIEDMVRQSGCFMTASAFGKILRCCLVLAVLGGCASKAGTDSAAPSTPEYSDPLVKSLYQAALTAEAGNNHLAAVNHYRNIFNRRPNDWFVLLGMARNLRYIGEAEAAIEALEAASKDFGTQEAFLIELGKARIAVGNAENAIKALKAAIKINGKKWGTHAALGIGYDLQQSYGEAWEAYEKANELSPGNPAVLNNMAISAALSGKIDLAISTLEGAPRVIRRNPQVRQNLALFYSIKGDLKKAKALAKMDLDEESVLNNLNIYKNFRAQSGKRRTQ